MRKLGGPSVCSRKPGNSPSKICRCICAAARRGTTTLETTVKRRAKASEPSQDLSAFRERFQPDSVIGIDPSLEHTGYAIWTPKEQRLGLIEPAPRKGLERLLFLRNMVLALLSRLKADGYTKPYILLEDYAYSARGQAAISLGEFGGVLRLALYEWDVPFSVIPPTQAKKFVTGKGVAQKSVILKEVYKRWNLDVDDDNIADAAGLMHLGMMLFGKEEAQTAFQIEVINDVSKPGGKKK